MLCPPSVRLLTLNDEDLSYLQNSESQAALQKPASIRLKCDTIFDTKLERVRELGPPIFDQESDDSCWTCDFCVLLLHAVQSTLDFKFEWNSDELQFDQTITPVRINIALHQLSIRKDQTPWADSEESVTAASLFGSATLSVLPSTGGTSLDNLRTEISSTVKMEVGFELFADPSCVFAKLLNIHRRPLDVSPVSDANLSKMRGWIQDCDENHKLCLADRVAEAEDEGYFVPARLLDVGSSTKPAEPRLVLTQDINSKVNVESQNKFTKYIALSYCWGAPEDVNRLLATSATIETMLESVPFNTLPAAFQDAVTFARTLGIQHLWIDSLCIIQDDSLDWQTESSKMARIFSNAHLTIVAAAGSTCHDRFLERSQENIQCVVPVQSSSPDLDDGHIRLRYRRHRGTDKVVETEDCRWISRGWTFQEERLARRVLIFGKTKFFLDCRSLERSEDTERHRLRPDWVESVREKAQDRRTHSNLENEVAPWRTTCDHWQTLCNHYSYRELTYVSDKLPAISGIASKFFKKAKCEYLAGLWKDYLIHDLFWFSAGPAQRPGGDNHATNWSLVSIDGNALRPAAYRAPSWSWASLDGRIYWPKWRNCRTTDCEQFVTIIEAQIKTHGVDPFGEVDGGHLKLSGYMLKVHVALNTVQDVGNHRWRLQYDGCEIATASLDVEKLGPSESMKCWALLFGKCRQGKSRKHRARGLILAEVEPRRDDVEAFHRVGIFYVSSEFPAELGDAEELWEKTVEKTIYIV